MYNKLKPSTPCGDLLKNKVIEAELQIKALNILEGKEGTVSALCLNLAHDLHYLKNGIGDLKITLKKQKLQIQDMMGYSAKLKDTFEHIEYIEKNLPKHFTIKDEVDKEVLASKSPLTVYKTEAETRVELTTTKPPRKQVLEIPTIAYLTRAEFDTIPIYLRTSNLKYEDMGAFINSFNKALLTKYQLISQPKTKIKDRQLYNRYKKEETIGTKGIFFVTEEDLKSAGSVKTHKIMQSLVSILRSFQRVREIRGEGIIRYAVAE